MQKSWTRHWNKYYEEWIEELSFWSNANDGLFANKFLEYAKSDNYCYQRTDVLVFNALLQSADQKAKKFKPKQ